jgi:hypothetical protein
MAGGDVFKVIQDNNLTKRITEFVSYTPTTDDGYRHIHRVIPPSGFIPYMDKCFSELTVDGFVDYIRKLVDETKTEDELLKIIQDLSHTLKALTKDKPDHVADSIVRLFCSMFQRTVIDPAIVKFILDDTVKLEREGKAIIFSAYRSKLKDLYTQANKLLLQNTKNSVNMTSRIISVPINDNILVGDAHMITNNILLKKNNYPSSSVEINGTIIPMLPIRSQLSDLNKQCIRQYIRSILSEQYGAEQFGDIIIYIMLGMMLKVVCSNVDEAYKNDYRIFGTIMLEKKKPNTEITELSRFENGDLPIPNTGKINDFYTFMNTVKNIMGIKSNISPMTLWYAMCLALNNPKLIVKQEIHCTYDIKKDFSIAPNELLATITGLLTPVNIVTLPKNLCFDFTCVITLEDCSSVGGYKINEHVTSSRSTCSPNFIISDAGYNTMFGQARCMCPVCYTLLGRNVFTKVGPKEVIDENIFSQNFKNPFHVTQHKSYQPAVQSAHYSVKDNSDNKISDFKNVSISSSRKGILILMRGTVGSGKTTYAARIEQAVKDLGGVCINEGCDKYCRTGETGKNASNMVASELKKIDSIDNPLLVVIIDTCGERPVFNTGNPVGPNIDVVFDYNFAGWTKTVLTPNYDKDKTKQYLAWSLRNVLRRPLHTPTTPYWLNPVSATAATCVTVHHKKAMSLFGGKLVKKVSNCITLDQILQDIEASANEYEEYLNKEKNIDKEIADIVASFKN